MVTLFETLHTVGLALLVFFVLPDLDAVKGVMLTNCVCIVPGVLGTCNAPRPRTAGYGRVDEGGSRDRRTLSRFDKH